jgi:hypothetical protein
MISKKLFCDSVKEMKRLNDAEIKVNDVFEQSDFTFSSFSFVPYTDVAFNLLVAGIKENDEDAADDICYWLYDLEFGTKYMEAWAEKKFDTDGNIINITNVEDFYDYLAQTY